MKFLSKLKEQWQADCTAIGHVLKNIVGKGLLICSILGGANEYLQLIPADWVPSWIKTAVVIAGVIAFIGGGLTKKDSSNSAPNNP